jgi:hypothetical protein
MHRLFYESKFPFQWDKNQTIIPQSYDKTCLVYQETVKHFPEYLYYYTFLLPKAGAFDIRGG